VTYYVLHNFKSFSLDRHTGCLETVKVEQQLVQTISSFTHWASQA